MDENDSVGEDDLSDYDNNNGSLGMESKATNGFVRKNTIQTKSSDASKPYNAYRRMSTRDGAALETLKRNMTKKIVEEKGLDEV